MVNFVIMLQKKYLSSWKTKNIFVTIPQKLHKNTQMYL